jgi:hypothetical protein
MFRVLVHFCVWANGFSTLTSNKVIYWSLTSIWFNYWQNNLWVSQKLLEQWKNCYSSLFLWLQPVGQNVWSSLWIKSSCQIGEANVSLVDMMGLILFFPLSSWRPSSLQKVSVILTTSAKLCHLDGKSYFIGQLVQTSNDNHPSDLPLLVTCKPLQYITCLKQLR